MNLSEQIKIETIASAVALASWVETWPKGACRDLGLELVNDILSWQRVGGERPLEPILSALAAAPEPYAGGLHDIFALHIRMIMEHGVEDGRVERGTSPGSYGIAT